MSELRNRIAVVLNGHSETDLGPDCACGWTWEGYGLWKDAHADHVADAVIAELGLRIQVAGPDGIVGTGDYRYVTDWKADE